MPDDLPRAARSLPPSRASRCPWHCADRANAAGQRPYCTCWEAICRRAKEDLCHPEEVQLVVWTHDGNRWRVEGRFAPEALRDSALLPLEWVRRGWQEHLRAAPASLDWTTAQVVVGGALLPWLEPDYLLAVLRAEGER